MSVEVREGIWLTFVLRSRSGNEDVTKLWALRGVIIRIEASIQSTIVSEKIFTSMTTNVREDCVIKRAEIQNTYKKESTVTNLCDHVEGRSTAAECQD